MLARISETVQMPSREELQALVKANCGNGAVDLDQP